MSLESIGPSILRRLDQKNRQREEVLAASRPLVRHAATAIRAAHRREWSTAEALLDEGRELLATMKAAARGQSDLESAGYAVDAQKEHAEAQLVYALLRGRPLLGPEAMEVEDNAWLHGLGEAAGELRRAALDAIRRGEVATAETFLERMDDIYIFLSTVDYPAAITRDLRRTNDMVRGVVERTRGDLTVALRQEALEEALDRVFGILDGSPPSS